MGIKATTVEYTVNHLYVYLCVFILLNCFITSGPMSISTTRAVGHLIYIEDKKIDFEPAFCEINSLDL